MAYSLRSFDIGGAQSLHLDKGRNNDRYFFAEGTVGDTPFLIEAHAGPNGQIDEAQSTFWVGQGRVPIEEFMKRTGILFELV